MTTYESVPRSETKGESGWPTGGTLLLFLPPQSAPAVRASRSVRPFYRIGVPSLSLTWPGATASVSHGCGNSSIAGSGTYNVKVTASGPAAPIRATRFPASFRSRFPVPAVQVPGSRHTGHFAARLPGRNRNDGTSLLLSRAGQPHRWPMDVTRAASMAHSCGCPPPPDRIDGPSLRLA